MAEQSTQQSRELELLRQLIGEWSVSIAMRTSDDKVVSGCGEITAVEIPKVGINSEIDTHTDGHNDHFENDLWSFDRSTGKVPVFGITSEGDAHDHVGFLKDDKTLELNWRGTFEDQDLEEKIQTKWLSKDQIEVKDISYSKVEMKLTTDYIFKRKQASSS